MADPKIDTPADSQQSGSRTETHSEPAHAVRVHGDDGMTGPHGSVDDHGGDHGHDDHAHGSAAALGPIDTRAWGAGLLGIALGLAVAVAFALGTGFLRL